MSCACQIIQPVPRCTTTLTIGTVASLATAVYVYIKNLGSGRTVRYDMTTDGAGTVTLDMSEAGLFYDVHNSFEIWVATAAAPQTRLTVTVGALSDTCLLGTFTDHYDGNIAEYTTYTATT